MSERYTCYEMTGKYSNGDALVYCGMVEILPRQTRQEACAWRLGMHKSKPKFCLSSVDAASLKICPAGPVFFNEEEAWLHEAVLTIISWHSFRGVTRGGPYVLKQLEKANLDELRGLAGICDLTSFAAKRAAVKERAATSICSGKLLCFLLGTHLNKDSPVVCFLKSLSNSRHLCR
jgi:hypothetical protein